jgi:hypothetical protein
MTTFCAFIAGCSDDGSSPGDGGGGGASSTTGGPSASTGTATGATTPATSGSMMQGGGGGASIPDPVLEEGWESGDGAWIIEGPASIETDPSRVRTGAQSLRVDFRDPACGPSSCNGEGNNCFENYPQVVSTQAFDLERYYASWWVYYPSDFIFYDGPCMPVRGSQGHFVRFSNFHTPHDPNDSFYQASMPDFGQYRAGDDSLGIRPEWHWVENDSGSLTIGRNLSSLTVPTASLAGGWNRYEIYVDLGTPGGFDGAIAWSVNDVVLYDIHGDALHVGEPLEEWHVWGDQAALAAEHPGLMRTTGEGFTRLGLVSNPNSSFGGRESDVYWIDDVVIADECPADRPICESLAR